VGALRVSRQLVRLLLHGNIFFLTHSSQRARLPLHPWLSQVRTFSNSTEASLATVAFYYWPWREPGACLLVRL
jgi:hypothetical protein